MHLLGAVAHSANHSSSMSRHDYVHLHSESACSADIQACTNNSVQNEGLVAFCIAAELLVSMVGYSKGA